MEKKEKGDIRKRYFLRVASHIFATNLVEEKLSNLQAVDRFCDSPMALLVFTRNEEKNTINLSNEIEQNNSNSTRVIFYKTRQVSLTTENLRSSVAIITQRGTPDEAFLNSLQQVYSKIYKENDQNKTDLHLLNLINELRETICSKVKFSESGIQEPSSLRAELEYWKRRSDSRSVQYREILEPLSNKLDLVDGQQLEELTGLLETAEECIDSLWKSAEPFPESRMKQIIFFIGTGLLDAISKKLEHLDVWKGDNAEDVLQLSIGLCDQWLFTVEFLTGNAWKKVVDNPWNGDALKLDFLKNFKSRLEQVMSLKKLGVHLARLLDEKDAAEKVKVAIANTMNGFNSGLFNIHSDSAWAVKLQEVYRNLEPIIEHTIPQIKKLMNPDSFASSEVIKDLHIYQHLLKLPIMRERLLLERELLLTRLTDSIPRRRHKVDQILNDNLMKSKYLSEVVGRILWIRKQIAEVEDENAFVDNLLNDLALYNPVKTKLTGLIEELKAIESEQYDSWCRDLNDAIDNQDSSVSLETNAQLLVFDRNRGTLSVSYSDRLIRLLKEVRQLTSLGFPVPIKIVSCASRAEKFYKYGIVLKQIAHFYNTIEQQMLPSQQAMMLDEALAFEKLIIPEKHGERSVSKITWSDPKKLERYIARLQEGAEKLTAKNRMLRKAHFEITAMVLKLMDTDLLKEMTKWKDILVDIRTKIAEQEQYGANRKTMRPWLLYWDKQIYKALQIQYQWGIESLHIQIPTIQAQLVFKERRVQLRPPIEEIRAKYYHELKKFLSIPYKFRGVQDTEQANMMFAKLAETNAARFHNVYEKAEQLFGKLSTVGSNFEEWIVLEEVNLEELIEEKFKKAEDWENQIKALKGRGRDAEKLPSEIKLDCIVVSTQPIRAAIDDMLQRLYDTLVWTLKNSAVSQMQVVSRFLTEAIAVLSSRPQSMEDIATVNRKHSEFAKSSVEIRKLIETIQDENLLLRSVAGNGVEQLPYMMQEWEKFNLMFDSHQLMIKDQVGYLKSEITKKIKLLNDESEKLIARWNQFKPKPERLGEDRKAMLEAIEVIKENRISFNELWEKVEALRVECMQVNVDEPDFPAIEDMRNDLESFEQSWLLYEEFNEEIKKLGEEEWIVFRSKTYSFDELLMKWKERLKTIPASRITIRIDKEIDSFMAAISGLKYCRDEALTADHWVEIFRLLKMPKGVMLGHLKFSDLLAVHESIIENAETLKSISARARSETTIREAIQELELWAAQTEFSLTDYKCTSGRVVKIIKDWKDTINSVKDSQALLQSLKSSPYYAQFTDKTTVWETKLMSIDQYVQKFNEIQRKWVYLEPIFGRGSMPSEISRFNRVDVEFRSMLEDVASDTRLVSLCSRNALQYRLDQIVDQLSRCHRALNNFLEEKRNVFPRFYFIGDDDLLEILGQSTNPNVIQAHLKKLFQGIHNVVFDENSKIIKAMVSADGEIVELRDYVKIVSNVEEWILDLTHSMKNTLKSLISECLNEESPDLRKYPAQVLCLVEQIRFCQLCEDYLANREQLKAYYKKLETDLDVYNKVQTTNKILENKLKSLILEKIHQISIVNELLKASTIDKHAWIWQKQLRFYHDSRTGAIIIRHIDAEFAYTYEYQGTPSDIVQTPLTEKCYLNLTQAMAMGLGGSPYGPAGTGKTESVKALGNLFGRQVIVFNCDEGIDSKSMSRIFIGLVQCGAWGCFDEFNRLDKDVLSAVSTQVQTIQDAIKSRTGKCLLNGKEVVVDANSAIFITMNPATRSYGGRQELPNNLKQLFRPVVMAVPDHQIIAETILYSKGFKDASITARKLTTLFRLSEEMLSKQQHYDWGLRALRTVLQCCGEMLASAKNRNFALIVVRALSLNTHSKLTFTDSRRFAALMNDVFPDVDKDVDGTPELYEPLTKSIEDLGFQVIDAQVKKVLELYEQLRQRMGVVIIGQCGAGKSTVWKVLHKALEISGKSVTLFTFNPKSMPRKKLLGYMDPDTREWFDGVITSAVRQAMKDASKAAWIVCDGNIDPEWIEALNSVLDDNKILTMPSGERIQLSTNVNFIFETDSLNSASPATVSRMGMLYVSEEIVSASSLVNCWLKKNDALSSELTDWINEHLYRCLDWISEKHVMSESRATIVQNILCRLKGVRTFHEFLVALFRGCAPFLNSETRKELALTVIFKNVSIPDSENPENIYYDTKTKGFACYSDDFSGSVPTDFTNENHVGLIQTSNAQSSISSMQEFLKPGNRYSFIVYGPEGSGKNMILRHCFHNDSDTQVVLLHCTAHTKSEQIHFMLSKYCLITSGPSGRVLKPKYKPNLVLYIKAINLVKPDKWGTCEAISFLQQLLTYQGYYDENLEWINIDNIQLVFSVNLCNSASLNQLPCRFKARLKLCCIDFPSEQNLITVYSSYLTLILQKLDFSVSTISNLANAMVQLLFEIRNTFKPTEYQHYIFTAKDLTKWVFGLKRYQIHGSDSSLDTLMTSVVYEAGRIFLDRLVSEDHRNKFNDLLVTVFNRGSGLLANDGTYFISPQVLLLSATNTGNVRLSPVAFKDYRGNLQKSANRYEFEVSQLNVPLFDEFVALCSKVDRILSSYGGSVMVVGRSGMGRRAAASLVAHIHQMRTFSLKVSSSYGIKQFNAELKEAMEYTAVNTEHNVFIMEDCQILEDAFLQTLNSVLACGDFPGLFSQQEFDSLSVKLREKASDESFDGDLHDFFSYKIRRYMHFVFVMNSDHPKFAKNCVENPSILTECSIIWLNEWNIATLLQIPQLMLQKNGLKNDERIIKYFPQIYDKVPSHVAIPLKYFAFIKTYVKIFASKQSEVGTRLDRIKAGVKKLTEAKEAVTKLQQEAAKKSKLLEEKQEEANQALKAISESMTGAKERRSDIEQLKTAAEKENVKIEQQKQLIEEQLREVEPLLKEAREAVGSIKSESLSEIRSLRAPPETIRDILQAVLLFMGILDSSWEAMRKFLAKNGVKEEIINFDAHNVTPDIRKKVVALVNNRNTSFDPKVAKRASAAAAPLAAWVVANLQYSAILEKITPLEQEKSMLTKNLGKAEKRIQKLSEGLKNVDTKVADLKANFEELMKEATQIKIGVDEEQRKIDAANTLIERLSGEFDRWLQQVEILQNQSTQLNEHAIIAAAYVTFLGSSTEQVRLRTLTSWLETIQTSQFGLLKFVNDDKEKLAWRNEGAPTDLLTLENLTIAFNTAQVPFIIDPNGNIAQFLKKHFTAKNVEYFSAMRSDFMTQIELGIRFGKVLIVDDVETFNPSLCNLLRKEFSLQGSSRYMVNLGNKTVEYNTDFRIFFCTKNSQITLPQYVKAAVNEINFATTRSGLSSQLLTMAVNIEQPELENRSVELTRNIEENKVKLEEVESLLLQTLASAEDSLLNNTQLLDSLNKSKENAETISVSISEMNVLQKELNEQRKAYLPLAESTSALYFAIHDLYKYNHMYSFNANTIVKLFKSTMLKAKESGDALSNFKELKKRLQNIVYNYVSRALFKSDRLCFIIPFIKAIQPDLFQQYEWELFVGLIFDEISEEQQTKPASWIEDDRIPYLIRLKKYLPSLYNKLRLEQEVIWKEFINSIDCEQKFPAMVADNITEFQKVLVIQAIRPNRLYSAITLFTKNVTKDFSLRASNFDLEMLYEKESTENEPVLIITGVGADPTQVLEDLASSKVGLEKFHQISMGQGQLQAAVEMLKYCAECGHWICIKNLHLSIESILVIYKEFCNIQRHPNFRFWLFSESDDNFPSTVLQDSLKITYESPPGVKNNLLRTLHQWQSLSINGSVIKMQCLYILAWLHALLQERRTFIPQGWTEFYEFNDSDLRAARQSVEAITANLQQENQIDWEFLRGLMQTVFYGNRVDKFFDFSVLVAYLHQNFNSKVINSRMMELKDNIKIPSSTRLQDYINATENQFCNEDPPSLFGLPENVRSAWAVSQSKILLEKLRNAQMETVEQFTFDRNKWQTVLGPILSAWKRLNAQNSLVTIPVPQAKHSEDPIEEVLGLEFVYAVSLVQTVHQSLACLSRCIRGALTPSSSILSDANSIIKHMTPQKWQDLWRGPAEPYQYISTLIYKTKSIQELKITAEKKQFFQSPIKLSKLFHPIGLLNALRQYTARRRKVSVDDLKMQNSWASNSLQEEIVLNITGIYIQGAIFKKELSPTCPSSPAFSTIPTLSVAWTPLNTPELYNSEESMLLPLYANPDRIYLVAELRVPCKNPAQWQTASVALFLSCI